MWRTFSCRALKIHIAIASTTFFFFRSYLANWESILFHVSIKACSIIVFTFENWTQGSPSQRAMRVSSALSISIAVGAVSAWSHLWVVVTFCSHCQRQFPNVLWCKVTEMFLSSRVIGDCTNGVNFSLVDRIPFSKFCIPTINSGFLRALNNPNFTLNLIISSQSWFFSLRLENKFTCSTKPRSKVPAEWARLKKNYQGLWEIRLEGKYGASLWNCHTSHTPVFL